MAEKYTLTNEIIEITVNSKGAELASLKECQSGREYMWQADPTFWGRTSPVLFPVVGAFKDGKFLTKERTYQMGQHGFARDMEFMLTKQTEDQIWFCLTDKDETWEKYPYAFNLEIGYLLEDRSVKVLWRVSNPSEEELPFSIGGHPAFIAPVRKEDEITCYVQFKGQNKVVSRQIEGGLATDIFCTWNLDQDGALAVTEEVFAKDALVVEESGCQEVALLDKTHRPYLTVSFDAPLFGIWTPPGKNAPFICIEPWYGRCDHTDFTGTLREREYGSILQAKETFEAAYTITV